MINWEPNKRPPKYECPKNLCFHWLEKGTFESSGLYNNLESARDKMMPVPESHCGCSFGKCIRLDLKNGDTDWYEPHEPNLEKLGLPWFYFISDPEKLCPNDKKMYMEYFKE